MVAAACTPDLARGEYGAGRAVVVHGDSGRKVRSLFGGWEIPAVANVLVALVFLPGRPIARGFRWTVRLFWPFWYLRMYFGPRDGLEGSAEVVKLSCSGGM